mmetsp:Transcript_7900/g.23430  ORF Transcript_7900/g.23430 Transcript_7900/m.23430 type:complete len:339 (+) Transcript_7900:102-1118(+)
MLAARRRRPSHRLARVQRGEGDALHDLLRLPRVAALHAQEALGPLDGGRDGLLRRGVRPVVRLAQQERGALLREVGLDLRDVERHEHALVEVYLRLQCAEAAAPARVALLQEPVLQVPLLAPDPEDGPHRRPLGPADEEAAGLVGAAGRGLVARVEVELDPLQPRCGEDRAVDGLTHGTLQESAAAFQPPLHPAHRAIPDGSELCHAPLLDYGLGDQVPQDVHLVRGLCTLAGLGNPFPLGLVLLLLGQELHRLRRRRRRRQRAHRRTSETQDLHGRVHGVGLPAPDLRQGAEVGARKEHAVLGVHRLDPGLPEDVLEAPRDRGRAVPQRDREGHAEV